MFSTSGNRAFRGQTFSVPHRPTGMTGTRVLAARRAAPHRPLSSGSKNAGPRGIVPWGMSGDQLAGGQRVGRGLQRLVGAGPPVDPDAAHGLGDVADDRGVEDLLLAQEAHRPALLGQGHAHDQGVEVAAVVAADEAATARGDVLDALDVEAGEREELGPGEGLQHLLGLEAAQLGHARAGRRGAGPASAGRRPPRRGGGRGSPPSGAHRRQQGDVVEAVGVGVGVPQPDAAGLGPGPYGGELARPPHELAVDGPVVAAASSRPYRVAITSSSSSRSAKRRDQVDRRGRGHDHRTALGPVLGDEEPGVRAGRRSSRTSAASLAAACTVAWSQPLAILAAWRVSSIAGIVSPITSKTLKSSPSPGIFGAVMTPACRRAVEITGPDAPASNVRSRSKNAAPAMEGRYSARRTAATTGAWTTRGAVPVGPPSTGMAPSTRSTGHGRPRFWLVTPAMARESGARTTWRLSAVVDSTEGRPPIFQAERPRSPAVPTHRLGWGHRLSRPDQPKREEIGSGGKSRSPHCYVPRAWGGPMLSGLGRVDLGGRSVPRLGL